MNELYILPFDHRSTFVRDLLGFKYPLSLEQKKSVEEAKYIVFDGFKQVYRDYSNKNYLGILCDEEFGLPILKEAKTSGINFAVCTEKSGQESFEFEYGDKFSEHLLKLKPEWAKALVRYNPASIEINIKQREVLKKLYDFCAGNGIKMMVEPLIIPTKEQLDEVSGDKKVFDFSVRPTLMPILVQEFYESGIFPQVWKIEAVETRRDWQKIIEAVTGKGSRKDSHLIVLGRGESWEKVVDWLKLASHFKEIIGFAVGRTVFWEPLVSFQKKELTRDEAVSEIAKRYKLLIEIWEEYRFSDIN